MRKVKANITRMVTERAIISLDNSGNVVEVLEVLEELDYDNVEVTSIIEVIQD